MGEYYIPVTLMHHQCRLSQVEFRMNFKVLQSFSLKLMLLLMVLNAEYIRPSVAESEISDLNLVSSKIDLTRKQLTNRFATQRYPAYVGYMRPPQMRYPSVPTPVRASDAFACPLCDSSVYSYCSHKLIHDSCCCDFPGAIYQKPPQCSFYDCSLLYAKSCYEHSLIKNCCCNNPY